MCGRSVRYVKVSQEQGESGKVKERESKHSRTQEIWPCHPCRTDV